MQAKPDITTYWIKNGSVVPASILPI